MRELSIPSVYIPEGSSTESGVSTPRETDVSKLKFPLTTVAAIVGTAIGVVTAQQLGQAGMKSDVRDILTRMELQAKIDDARQAADEERYQAIRITVDDMKRRMELLQLQYQQIDKTVSQQQPRPR